jgi:hypothetical protein
VNPVDYLLPLHLLVTIMSQETQERRLDHIVTMGVVVAGVVVVVAGGVVVIIVVLEEMTHRLKFDIHPPVIHHLLHITMIVVVAVVVI